MVPINTRKMTNSTLMDSPKTHKGIPRPYQGRPRFTILFHPGQGRVFLSQCHQSLRGLHYIGIRYRDRAGGAGLRRRHPERPPGGDGAGPPVFDAGHG